MARQLSTKSDYASVIARAIETAKDDPVHLRSLIYNLARQSIGRYVLDNYHTLGSEGLQQHLQDLEAAIDKVENVAREPGSIATAEPRLLDRTSGASNNTVPPGQAPRMDEAPLLDRSASSSSRTALTVRDAFADLAVRDDDWVDKAPVVLREVRRDTDVRAVTEILEPTEIWEPAFGRGPRPRPKRTASDVRWTVQLATAALIGVGIYAVILTRSDFFQSGFDRPPAASLSQGAAMGSVPNAAGFDVSAAIRGASRPSLGFPLPSVFGVYAVSTGKRYGLDRLAIRVPDPRVEISAMISEPSRVTIPDGKISFVIYRRDLAASAPEEVFVRVVAEVERQLKFTSAGPPVQSKVSGEWAVRDKSFEYQVGPVDGVPEMILLRPADPQLSLAPGRYALVIGGQGYDFTVAGQVTDAVHCLERTNVIGGTVYSECH